MNSNEFTAGDRLWRIRLNLGDLRRLRTQGIDLLRLDERPSPDGLPLAMRLRTDPLLVGDILWQCLAGQIEEAGLSESDFCEMLDGRALADAYSALTAALLDFFHSLSRPDLVETLQATARLVALATDQTQKKLQALDLPKAILGAQSPDSPPSQASTPGPGPSGNSPPPPRPGGMNPGNRPPPSPRP
jgi:hypothetical protein